MPTLTLVNSQIIEARADGRMAHREFPETAQVITVVSVADAATKLQTALTPLVGAPTAATHATAFTVRQGVSGSPSKHVVPTGTGLGMTALYHP